jgi:hypothetical protein
MQPFARTRSFRITYFVIMLLVVFAVALDVFISFGVPTAPEEVGRTMCVMRPLGFFGRAVIRQSWLDYANAQCASYYPVEPAISIIGFSIKASLAIVAIVIIVGASTLIEQNQKPNLQAAADDISTRQGALIKLKSLVGAAVTWVAIVVGCWVAFMSTPPQQFHYWVAAKIVEDLLILVVIAAAIIACECLNALVHWVRLSIARV